MIKFFKISIILNFILLTPKSFAESYESNTAMLREFEQAIINYEYNKILELAGFELVLTNNVRDLTHLWNYDYSRGEYDLEINDAKELEYFYNRVFPKNLIKKLSGGEGFKLDRLDWNYRDNEYIASLPYRDDGREFLYEIVIDNNNYLRYFKVPSSDFVHFESSKSDYDSMQKFILSDKFLMLEEDAFHRASIYLKKALDPEKYNSVLKEHFKNSKLCLENKEPKRCLKENYKLSGNLVKELLKQLRVLRKSEKDLILVNDIYKSINNRSFYFDDNSSTKYGTLITSGGVDVSERIEINLSEGFNFVGSALPTILADVPFSGNINRFVIYNKVYVFELDNSYRDQLLVQLQDGEVYENFDGTLSIVMDSANLYDNGTKYIIATDVKGIRNYYLADISFISVESDTNIIINAAIELSQD